MAFDPAIFKAYDVRGIYPEQIDEPAVEQIGQAYALMYSPERVVVGCDVRVSSPSLKAALIKGLTMRGSTVIDIGMVSTDMMYFAVTHLKAGGGLIVSASHNPAEYNGLKIVVADAVPVSSDSGPQELRDMVVTGLTSTDGVMSGEIETFNILPAYLEHLRHFADLPNLRPLKIVANGNFGMAATVAQELFKSTPVELSLLNAEPDGRFPKGRPDPMWADNRTETIALINKKKADLGVAWDVDADRCFFFDENGQFINPYYITAMLAEILLKKNGGGKILVDPRLIWATEEVVKQNGGELVINKAGHTFIKERMRHDNILFGGESSAHYYFRDNHFADNGMIPLLLVLTAMSETGQKMSELIAKYKKLSFSIEEENFTVENGKALVSQIESIYRAQGGAIDQTDGASVNFDEWRFNVRTSNTEPLLRLNMEARNGVLLAEKLIEIKSLITELATQGSRQTIVV